MRRRKMSEEGTERSVRTILPWLHTRKLDDESNKHEHSGTGSKDGNQYCVLLTDDIVN